ncbi:MAG: hypothetical protein JSS20_09445 [Proteobacteria bacterium]|nr:hypothetical protein [Pseudomonadota bacterium]
MKALPLKASLLAAALFTGAGQAAAADLDYGYVPPPDRYSSAYEDPRYRDLYAPEPRPYAYAPPPPSAPVPPGYVYRGPDRSAGWNEGPYGAGCLPRHEIKRRLNSDGWRDFYDLEAFNGYVRVKARRPNGDLFALKVDRCTGDVLRADVLDRNGPGPYAYDAGPRRYDRPYY